MFQTLLVAIVVFTGQAAVTVAAPATTSSFVRQEEAAPPDWLSAETASRLELGFDVLIPAEVPEPFSGEPSVDASEGFYSLYWLIPGAPPTYLLITGEVGGTIPDFSFYDRNNQLKQNAEVQGQPAYHDLTPIYDKVYWKVGETVYVVDSHNLASIDSLTLANSLFPLGEEPPAAGGSTGSNSDEPVASGTLSVKKRVESGATVAINVEGVESADLVADAGTFAKNDKETLTKIGDGSYDWTAPETEEDLTVTFSLVDRVTKETVATAKTTVTGIEATSPPEATITCPKLATAGGVTQVTISGRGVITIDASDGTFPAEGPNLDFDKNASGNDVVTGTLPKSGSVELDWLAPGIEMTAYFFVFGEGETLLAECGTVVTYDEIAPTPTATRKPGTGGPGDGTDLPNRYDDIVTTVLEKRQSTDDDGDEATPTAKSTKTPKPDATATAKPKKKTKTPTPTVKPTRTKTPKPTKTPTRSATLTPTIVPTATFAPVTGTDGMVALDIGPAGGELVCTAGTAARVVIPANALNEQAMVTIRPIAKSSLPQVEGIRLLSSTAFDLTIAEATGVSIEELNLPATLTVDLPKDAKTERYHLYRIQGSNLIPLPNVQIGETGLTTSLTQFSRVVIGVPSATVVSSTERDPKPFILAALGFVTVMMIAFGVGSFVLRRRAPSITPRRTMPKRARIR